MATELDDCDQVRDERVSEKTAKRPWQRPYVVVINQLQIPAVIGVFVLMALSAAPGLIQWLFVLRHDHHIGEPFTMSLWAGYGLIGVTGVLGYFTMTPLMLSVHATTTTVTGAAMVITYSMVYFSAQMRCAALQIGHRGCSDCPCAIDDSCQAADKGPGASLSQCTDCEAIGRDTCADLLAAGGISSWGGLLMAPLFAAVAALAHVTADRILTQKQMLSVAVIDARAAVAAAYDALQAHGTLAGFDAAGIAAALTVMCEAEHDVLLDEARAFAAAASEHGYTAFADLLPAPPTPRGMGNSVVPEASTAADRGPAELAVEMAMPQLHGDTTDLSDSPGLSPMLHVNAAFRDSPDFLDSESPPVGIGQGYLGGGDVVDGDAAAAPRSLPVAWGEDVADASDIEDSDVMDTGKSAKKEKKNKKEKEKKEKDKKGKEKKEKKDKKDRSLLEDDPSRLGGEESPDGTLGKTVKKHKEKKEKKEKKDKKGKHEPHDHDTPKKSKSKR
eukprot:jgi/Ulvmu1/11775/UM008_0189.1